ncbi:MAG: sugar ABC transporter permease [Anaerolineales bacterium]|nr:sugar ABC transporter permease [Anaerolineales bacterium]
MRSSTGRLSRHRAMLPHWAMLSPYLGGALVLVAIPALLMLLLAFFRYDALSAPVWVGWKNFSFLFADPLTQVAFFNTLFFAVLAVPLRLLVALGLALLYQRERTGTGVYRALAFLPSIVPDAAYALLWLWFLNPLYGPLNGVLRWMGLDAPGWLTDYPWAKPGMVLMWTFQIAEGLVLLLAALKALPQETLDAARVDGANRLNVFRRIILPLITPWLALLAVRDTILSLQSTFAPALLMTGGGPYYATYFVPLLIYEEAFDGLRFGQGMAAALLLVLATTVLVGLVFWLFEGWGDVED